MSEILARCGYRCDLCRAYRENVKDADDRKKLADAWFMYYGFRISPEKILCDGCSADEKQGASLIDPNCRVRLCTISRNISSCAYCGDFSCELLQSRLADRKEIEKELKIEISDEDYRNYVRPYEGRKKLESIRDGFLKKIGVDE